MSKEFDINEIEPGDRIKAIFRPKSNCNPPEIRDDSGKFLGWKIRGEYMYVTVKSIDTPNTVMTGRLMSKPMILPLRQGQEVTVSFNDIIEHRRK